MVHDMGIETEVYDFPLWVVAGGRDWSYFKKLAKGTPKRVGALRNFINSKKIDVVYTNTIACMDGAIAAKLENIPHIWHVHEILTNHTYVKSYLPHSVLKMAIHFLSKVVIVPSEAAKRHYKHRICHNKIKKIYNGVDIDHFSNHDNTDDIKTFRSAIGLHEQKIVALIGYFNDMKGHDIFVDAAKIVSERFKETTYLFAGDEDANRDYRDAIKQKIRDYHMEDRFVFLGIRNDIERIMRSIDVFVSASRVESFSNVICEAMAAGKPVVATRSGGPEEIIVDGKTGFLVPVDNPEMMAAGIITLLAGEEEAKKMGENGRRRVEEVFNMQEYVKNIESVVFQTIHG
jgi:glycosyltransferase involved in cell wall biosynthesis